MLMAAAHKLYEVFRIQVTRANGKQKKLSDGYMKYILKIEAEQSWQKEYHEFVIYCIDYYYNYLWGF